VARSGGVKPGIDPRADPGPCGYKHGVREDRPVDPEDVMAGMLDRIKEFARSPQGRRTAEQVRRAAADPRRRAQAQEMLRKFGKRR
jgi:hypothetical protein